MAAVLTALMIAYALVGLAVGGCVYLFLGLAGGPWYWRAVVSLLCGVLWPLFLVYCYFTE